VQLPTSVSVDGSPRLEDPREKPQDKKIRKQCISMQDENWVLEVDGGTKKARDKLKTRLKELKQTVAV